MHPVLFNLGPFKIYSYGMFMALAFFAAVFLMERDFRVKGIPPSKISGLYMIVFISGLLGARIMYVLANLSYYMENLPEIFMLHRGGLMFHGGFISGAMAMWVYLKKSKLPLFPVMDTIALYLPVGQAIGRIGCLLNGCCFGKECALPWAVALGADTTTRHPTQIYEAAGSLAIFIILRRISRRKIAEGSVFSLYLILYPVNRIIAEAFRQDLPKILMGFSFTQIFSVFIFITGIISSFAWKKRSISSY